MMKDSKNCGTASESAPLRPISKLIRRITMGFRTRLDERLRDHKVTTAQLRMLYELRERPGGSGAQMARALFVSPQSAQTMLVRAVQRGWVTRGKDPENERLVSMRLTDAGRELLEYAEGVVKAMEGELWDGVSAEELGVVRSVLERVAGRFEE